MPPVSPAIVLTMYCSNVGYSAGEPRKASQNINFQLAPRKTDHVDDVNGAVFADAQSRGANLNLNNVTAEVAAKFSGAPRVKVTVEILED